jgi:hypothetical protein
MYSIHTYIHQHIPALNTSWPCKVLLMSSSCTLWLEESSLLLYDTCDVLGFSICDCIYIYIYIYSQIILILCIASRIWYVWCARAFSKCLCVKYCRDLQHASYAWKNHCLSCMWRIWYVWCVRAFSMRLCAKYCRCLHHAPIHVMCWSFQYVSAYVYICVYIHILEYSWFLTGKTDCCSCMWRIWYMWCVRAFSMCLGACTHIRYSFLLHKPNAATQLNTYIHTYIHT